MNSQTSAQSAEPLTAMEAVQRSAAYLERHEVEAPRLSAELLLADLLGLDRLKLYLQFDRPLTSPERDAYREVIVRRGKHEPVAYLLGRRAFHSLSFEVGPAVLIPRPETEHLVDAVLTWVSAQGLDAPRLLEVGVGSGCVVISLLHALPKATALAIDLCPDALALAERNARQHEVADRLSLRQADMEAIAPGTLDETPLDVVVSNPPYIADEEWEALMPDVREHEPALALRAVGDPLRYYRAVVAMGSDCLRQGGLLALEQGRAPVRGLLDNTPAWREIAVMRDLNGHERVLTAVRG